MMNGRGVYPKKVEGFTLSKAKGGENKMENIGTTVTDITANSMIGLGNFVPQFLAGLILLIIGLLASGILKEVLLRSLKLLHVGELLAHANAWFNKIKTEGAQTNVWLNMVSELVRWTVMIMFLAAAAEAWGLSQVSGLLNQFLIYIPNVFVAVVVGFIGLVVANLVSNIVNHASKSLGHHSAHILTNVARYALIFFTALVVLNQLGVASDLVRILFTGIVAMLAIAGGIAFGLGGQDSAKKVLEELQKKNETNRMM